MPKKKQSPEVECCPCGVPLDEPCLKCFPDGDDPTPALRAEARAKAQGAHLPSEREQLQLRIILSTLAEIKGPLVEKIETALGSTPDSWRIDADFRPTGRGGGYSPTNDHLGSLLTIRMDRTPGIGTNGEISVVHRGKFEDIRPPHSRCNSDQYLWAGKALLEQLQIESCVGYCSGLDSAAVTVMTTRRLMRFSEIIYAAEMLLRDELTARLRKMGQAFLTRNLDPHSKCD